MTSQFATSPAGPAEPAPGRDASADARTLAELREPSDRPVLIKGAIILSQDPAVGDYAAGDILVRDGKIAQVGEDLARQAGEAVVIDAAGTIAVPGFVDAHVHAWEGQLRGAAPALDFGGYLSFTAFGYGPQVPVRADRSNAKTTRPAGLRVRPRPHGHYSPAATGTAIHIVD
jgi:hypothetical protein